MSASPTASLALCLGLGVVLSGIAACVPDPGPVPYSATDEIPIRDAGNEKEVRLQAGSYGWAADGEWHNLSFSLSDFAKEGLDLGQVTVPLMLLGKAGSGGEALLIDNLYFTAK